MRSLVQLTRSAALPAAVAVVVLGAGSAFAATSLVGSTSTPTQTVADETSTGAPTGTGDANSTASGGPTGGTPTGTETAGEPTETGSAPPETITCDTARNHGEWVSYVARTTPQGEGFSDAVRAAAQSDCGKKSKADPTGTATAPGKSGESHRNDDGSNGKSDEAHGKAHQPHGDNQGNEKKN